MRFAGRTGFRRLVLDLNPSPGAGPEIRLGQSLRLIFALCSPTLEGVFEGSEFWED